MRKYKKNVRDFMPKRRGSIIIGNPIFLISSAEQLPITGKSQPIHICTLMCCSAQIDLSYEYFSSDILSSVVVRVRCVGEESSEKGRALPSSDFSLPYR